MLYSMFALYELNNELHSVFVHCISWQAWKAIYLDVSLRLFISFCFAVHSGRLRSDFFVVMRSRTTCTFAF